ncbi:MAG: peptide deformylase [Sulfurimicrobium sp.]|jgi:peptide deformylase|nr:peptide deformylase [Sulfurimicrobium sp.]MDP1703733.1 peptide deformylase [Sulfurimicrobium sp.]MDP2200337.1 peptide deformylase [Sulfurimicrobium sp.]MDP2963664.1 peptide deformylase [Sulfurimicrobium sp.]MDZ7657418.1 peptide deformylase [Sulfurimicrobium sp.]
MALLSILHYPDQRLHTIASPVKEVNAEIRKLVDDMAQTMYSAPGIGLAATQVNVHKQVIVVDISESHDKLMALINPRIISRDGVGEREEGCLSVPGIYEKVTRAERIAVEALDRDGKPFTLHADGLLAVCIQHEIDHLQGKVFIEYLSRLKQTRIKIKLQKQQRETM